VAPDTSGRLGSTWSDFWLCRSRAVAHCLQGCFPLPLARLGGGAGDYTTMPARSTAGPDDGTQRATVRPCGRLGTVQPREPAVTTARADAGRLAAVTADLVCGLLQAGEQGRYGPPMGILVPMLVARWAGAGLRSSIWMPEAGRSNNSGAGCCCGGWRRWAQVRPFRGSRRANRGWRGARQRADQSGWNGRRRALLRPPAWPGS